MSGISVPFIIMKRATGSCNSKLDVLVTCEITKHVLYIKPFLFSPRETFRVPTNKPTNPPLQFRCWSRKHFAYVNEMLSTSNLNAFAFICSNIATPREPAKIHTKMSTHKDPLNAYTPNVAVLIYVDNIANSKRKTAVRKQAELSAYSRWKSICTIMLCVYFAKH